GAWRTFEFTRRRRRDNAAKDREARWARRIRSVRRVRRIVRVCRVPQPPYANRRNDAGALRGCVDLGWSRRAGAHRRAHPPGQAVAAPREGHASRRVSATTATKFARAL